MLNKYRVIGLMSGTSLDGLDLAFCEFEYIGNRWEFNIVSAITHEYSHQWRNKLSGIETEKALDLALLHVAYGNFMGRIVDRFIVENNLIPDFIASHGHTVFHQPDWRLTLQIGSGAAIAAMTQLPVVCDFRTTDVALGGQGAPLVPIGDQLLFSNYDACINLGGFANISFNQQDERIAFDICPVNIVLNFLCKELDLLYDEGGLIARQGIINPELLIKLNALEFYDRNYPKSLSKEWVLRYFLPLLNTFNIPVTNKLRTAVEHIAIQIASTINTISSTNQPLHVLVTGGGTFNDFLLERIMALTPHKLIVPDKNLINYKEALLFAFLGVLRWRKETNVLASVTGAKRNNTGGCIYWY